MFQNHYETVFILTPVLSEAQIKDTVQSLKSFLTDNGAELINEELWGLRKLAYPIQHKNSGYYQLFEFKGGPEIVAKLETVYKRDEKVLRYLTTKLDKHGVEYAAKRKSKGKKSATEKTTAEA